MQDGSDDSEKRGAMNKPNRFFDTMALKPVTIR
jgi:hypothetical protein